MRDFGEYLRAYWAYVSTNLGWGSSKICNCVARWNVCPAWNKDVSGATGLGDDNMDGWMGAARLYLCALRNVETAPCSDCELK